jgi:hypothetical protein
MEQEVNAQGAARLTGRNERTIRKHIKDGSLPARKTHYDWRIRVADLEARYGTYRKPPPVLVQQPRPVTQSDFATRAEAARWLARHGVNVLNPKNWHGWREVELTPRAVLALALRVQNTARWRIPWRLEKCGDENCVCREMLNGDS